MKNKIHQIGLPGFELDDYIKESIEFLRTHEPLEGYFVGFSGGKDSITTLELCRMAGVKHFPYFSCTRIDPPEIYKFIKIHYPEVIWLFPKKSFYELIQIKMPPMRTRRWCCDSLKKEPSKGIPLHHRVMGIRSEESFKRRSRPRIDKYNKKQILYKPVFHWPEWAIWEFIELYKLPYPSLYDEGFNRIGCIVCPFSFASNPSSVKYREISQKRWPGVWKAFEHAVKRWAQKTIDSGLKHNQKYTNADDFYIQYTGGATGKIF